MTDTSIPSTARPLYQHRVTDRITPWIDQTLVKIGRGEKIVWETGIAPGPQGEAMVVVVFWLPAAVLGGAVQASFPVADPLGCTEADIEHTVTELIRQLREGRSRQIADSVPGNPEAAPRQTPSGLLLGR